jgi:hypothetical protein
MYNSKVALDTELAQVKHKLLYKIRTQLNIKTIRKYMKSADYWTSISSLMHFKDFPQQATRRGERM